MKFDTKVDIISSKKVSDGMGGSIEVENVIVKTVDAVITPLKSSMALKEYGVESTTSIKMFTKDLLPITNDNKFLDVHLKINDGRYKIVDFADFKKIKMLYLELMK